MNDLRTRLNTTAQESETYKQRIQKLMGENSSLTEEMRGAQ
jgi:regulator of replication initiation timing